MEASLPEITLDPATGASRDADADPQASLTYDGWFSGWYRDKVRAVMGQTLQLTGREAGAA